MAKAETNAIDSIKTNLPTWASTGAETARLVLSDAYDSNRPVVLLLGAGLSVDAGIPLAGQLSQYLVQVSALVQQKGFASARQYLEEVRWPSRHDLRIELMLELQRPSLRKAMRLAERRVSQAAVVSELRRASPTLAFGLDEVFGQLRKDQWNQKALKKEFAELSSLANNLAKRVPRNVAYRSLLFHLCDRSQALIDGCLDHFIRDRAPTTTHQFIVFVTQLLRSRVVLSTNFDPLLEHAFAAEGLQPRVYEIQGEGSIPSAKMLLSQHFSIVKLHGGAHQMRTGFDLDEPLSPAVLASFYELFDRLEEQSGKKPLMLVMGYSGSDRRVMDIVSTHIKRWKSSDWPCVLWVNRDPWIPALLKSAVETHPHVLYGAHRDLRNVTRPERRESPGASKSRDFPAHLVQYQEGRLFLLETYQHLARSFPISRSNYQAVNFVPHSIVRQENKQIANATLSVNTRWNIALLTAQVGGGSSSQLAELAHDFDGDNRVIWIDLAEVPSVSALIDVMVERLGKFDHRLQAIRRPLLLHSLLYEGDEPTVTSAIRLRELTLATRWLQHALRRGQYLVALDSLDEFPGSHPATASSEPNSNHHYVERRLLCDFISSLLRDPAKLGDSRIAIAEAQEELETTRSDKASEEAPTQNKLYIDLKEQFRRQSGVEPNRVRFIELPGKSVIPTQNRDSLLFAAWKAYGTQQWDKQCRSSESKLILEQYRIPILVVAACCRRIRSEILLTQPVSHLIAAMDAFDCEKSAIELFKDEDFFRTALWDEPDSNSARARGSRANTVANDYIIKAIRKLSETSRVDDDEQFAAVLWDAENKVTNNGAVTKSSSTRWLYRIEGGYHWMHRTIRDGLYNELLRAYPELICLAHNRIAEMCHDEIYDHSRDPRAFLEYLFHRTIAIKTAATMCIASDNAHLERAVAWLDRLLRTLQREKANLLTRARLPSLIHQLRQLLKVVSDDLVPLVATSPANRDSVANAIVDLLGVVGDLLLAAGHPHSAIPCHIARMLTILEVSHADDIYNLGSKEFQLGAVLDGRGWTTPVKKAIETLRQKGAVAEVPEFKLQCVLADLAYTIQEPFLSAKLPEGLNDDWVNEMQQNQSWDIVSRENRLEICSLIYNGLDIDFCQKRKELSRTAPLPQEYYKIDFARTILKRQLELDLLVDFSPLLQTAQLYTNISLKLPIWALGREIPTIPTVVEKDEEHCWRVTPNGSRYECYRLCLQARRIAIFDLRDVGNWRRIQGLFVDAEAVLNRQGEPADLQALAITRLTYAEHAMRRAEVLTWRVAQASLDSKYPHKQFDIVDKNNKTEAVVAALEGLIKTRFPGSWPRSIVSITDMAEETMRSGPDIRSDLDEARYCHDLAAQLLSSVEAPLNEGRGENRWHFYHLLTLARVRIYQALRIAEDAPGKAMDDLVWAGRYLIAALSNCGKYTDRRFVLKTWWKALRSYMAKLLANDEQLQEEWSKLQSRLGVDWNVNWRSI